MPQSKEEIVRYVNDWIARMKQRKQADTGEVFAEITLEGESPAPIAPSSAEPVSPPDPQEQALRSRFREMRRLSRGNWFAREPHSGRMQTELFYKQAKLMVDAEDDYPGQAPFSMYFPDYQSMGYEQLRTYFTWRSKVRRGVVEKTFFSYVFVYLYELINHIGVQDSEEGFRKLMELWEAYRPFEPKLDHYLADWVRDYYIVNSFSCSFEALLQAYPLLREFYQPEVQLDAFDRYYEPFVPDSCRTVNFWREETLPVQRGCFNAVMEAVEQRLSASGLSFSHFLFLESAGNVWTPFQHALYHPDFSQTPAGKTVTIPGGGTYRFDGERWSVQLVRLSRANGRQMLRYIARRIEQFYRRAVGFRRQIKADRSKIDCGELERLPGGSEGFFACIDAAIERYYSASRHKAVTVDPQKLEQIRERAQLTQEKLLATLEEPEEAAPCATVNSSSDGNKAKTHEDAPPASLGAFPQSPGEDGPWERFAAALSEEEGEALRLLLRGASGAELAAYARERHLMPEVLWNGINEKAADTVEDTILESADGPQLFAEYQNDLERVMLK